MRVRNILGTVNNSHCELQGQITALREEVRVLRKELEERPAVKAVASELIPPAPLQGIEIVPKREVVIPDVLSIENRLLLNKVARKALEAEEMGEHGLLDRVTMDEAAEVESVAPVAVTKEEEVAEEEEVEEEAEVEAEEEEAEEEELVEEEAEEEEVEAEEELVEEEEAEEEEAEAEEELVEEAEEEEEEEAEEETEEEGAEEEAEEVELEEFEYKGSTYYRDGEGNVFMTDEDGELMEEPIGVWNEAKQRIVVKKAAA
jgi:exosome complex component RRP41